MATFFSAHGSQRASGQTDDRAQLGESEEVVANDLHSAPLAFEMRGVKLAALQSIARLAKAQGGEWTIAKVCVEIIGGQNVDDITAKVSYTLQCYAICSGLHVCVTICKAFTVLMIHALCQARRSQCDK